MCAASTIGGFLYVGSFTGTASELRRKSLERDNMLAKARAIGMFLPAVVEGGWTSVAKEL